MLPDESGLARNQNATATATAFRSCSIRLFYHTLLLDRPRVAKVSQSQTFEDFCCEIFTGQRPALPITHSTLWKHKDSSQNSVLTAICRWTWVNQYQNSLHSPFWILLELKMTEEVVITGAIRCAKLQSNCHHQQTNTQLFTGWMSCLSPNQRCQSTEKKIGVKTILYKVSQPQISWTWNIPADRCSGGCQATGPVWY